MGDVRDVGGEKCGEMEKWRNGNDGNSRNNRNG